MIRIAGLVFDLDGVLENNDELEPGAADLAQYASACGLPFVVLTNDIRTSCYERLDRLQAWGIPIDRRAFLTPYDTLRDVLESRELRSPAFFGAAMPREIASICHEVTTDHDSVILGDVKGEIDQLAQCYEFIHRGLPLFALQKNSFVRDGDRWIADVGYHVAAWEFCLGATATVVGKPSSFAYSLACRLLGCHPGCALMISDSYSVDLLGAQAAGMQTLLIETHAQREEIEKCRLAGLQVTRDLPALLKLIMTND